MILRIKVDRSRVAMVIENDRVVQAAPYLAFMMGWSEERVLEYAAKRKWPVFRQIKGARTAWPS